MSLFLKIRYTSVGVVQLFFYEEFITLSTRLVHTTDNI